MDPATFAASRQLLTERPVIDVSRLPTSFPTSYDWRNNGSVVTPVKNQEQCGRLET